MKYKIIKWVKEEETIEIELPYYARTYDVDAGCTSETFYKVTEDEVFSITCYTDVDDKVLWTLDREITPTRDLFETHEKSTKIRFDEELRNMLYQLWHL